MNSEGRVMTTIGAILANTGRKGQIAKMHKNARGNSARRADKEVQEAVAAHAKAQHPWKAYSLKRKQKPSQVS